MLRSISRLYNPISFSRGFSTQVPETPEERFKFGVSHQSSAIGKIINDAPISHAKGSWLYLENGRKFLDFACGIAVTNTGHCHPKVVAAAKNQLDKIIHGQVNVGLHRPMIDLTDRLLSILPSNLSHFFFANSGAEAIENAVKVARTHTKKPNIIVFQGSFHGRTIATSALTRSKTVYKAGFGPLMDGVFVAPFPYCNHCKCVRSDPNACCGNPLEELELLLKQQTSPSETAAILIEPILGEGGYVVPPAGFLRSLRKLCDKHNMLLIVDEIQTGFGRTGKFFSIEHFLDLPSESPDILVMAKGIASGLPLSAIACKKELLATLPGGSIGGTYGGNAVACAAGVATIDAMKEEKMLENAQERGQQLRQHLHDLKAKYPSVVRDVRGLGLMNAIELIPQNGHPVVGDLGRLCQERDLLVMSAGVFDTIRFMPPLTVSAAEVDDGMGRFSSALEAYLKLVQSRA